MNGFKAKIGRLRYKLAGITAGISTAIMMSPITAQASTFDFTTEASGVDAQGADAMGLMKGLIKFVGGAFGIVGGVFAFMGIWKVANAFRNDNNPEAISSGAKDIVVGGLFIVLGLIAGAGGFDKLFPKA